MHMPSRAPCGDQGGESLVSTGGDALQGTCTTTTDEGRGAAEANALDGRLRGQGGGGGTCANAVMTAVRMG